MNRPSELKLSLQQFEANDFESLVASLWSEMGWSTEVTQSSRDHGIDIIAIRSGVVSDKVVIQAKCYGVGNKVGRPEIQQYNTLKQQEPDVDSVIVVTSSDFTTEASKLAKTLNIKTVNGIELAEACLKHFSTDYLSNITEQADNYPDSNLTGQRKSSGQAISTENLSSSEQELANVYRNHLRRISEGMNRRALLFFKIELHSDETSEYVVEGGRVHTIQFPSESPALLLQLQQTAKKYGWEVLHTETYGPGAGGVEMIVPPEDAEMFTITLDTGRNESPSPKRQARISKLVLERVYDQELSGTEVSEPGSSNTGNHLTRVIK